MINNPTHLLSSLGVLASFSIFKVITKEELMRATNKIKKVCKNKNSKKFNKLLMNALMKNTQKCIGKEIPPGLIFDENSLKKEEMDLYYMELSAISEAIANKLAEEKLTKHQICFIINALINILEIESSDFEEFHKKFSEYNGEDEEDEDGEEQ